MKEDKLDERREIISQLEVKFKALEARHKKLLDVLKKYYSNNASPLGSKWALDAIKADEKAGEHE